MHRLFNKYLFYSFFFFKTKITWRAIKRIKNVKNKMRKKLISKIIFSPLLFEFLTFIIQYSIINKLYTFS